MNKEIYFPRKSPHGYFDKAMNRYFNTKNEKRMFMNANGIVEDGSMESDKKRISRNCEIINEARRKNGLKPKTERELLGDSRGRC